MRSDRLIGWSWHWQTTDCAISRDHSMLLASAVVVNKYDAVIVPTVSNHLSVLIMGLLCNPSNTTTLVTQTLNNNCLFTGLESLTRHIGFGPSIVNKYWHGCLVEIGLQFVYITLPSPSDPILSNHFI